MITSYNIYTSASKAKVNILKAVKIGGTGGVGWTRGPGSPRGTMGIPGLVNVYSLLLK